ncbi:O-antigen ligase family protein [Nocardioides sp. GCM10028917]|uniref:O-antigen ligase family protein n=1 Tax=Nocardioides sp. GCM10028917 TaxID=3273408 RepID=UPI003610DB20
MYTVAMSADRISPLPASQVLRVVIATCSGLILLLVARRTGERHSIPPLTAFVMLFFVCAIWTFSVNVLLAPTAPVVDAFGRIAPLCIVGFLFVAIRTGSVNWRIAALSLAISIGLQLALGAVSQVDWAECTQFKCGPAGRLYVGGFASENTLARLAGFGFLLALALRRHAKWLWPSLLAASVLVLYSSGSRTSQLAVGIALIAWWGWHLTRSRSLKRLLSFSAPAAIMGFGLWMVYTAGPSDYSNRGGIWARGVAALRIDWLLGAGIDNWSTHVLARNYMHSQGLLLLYAGGVVAVVSFVGMATSALLMASRRNDGYLAALVVYVLISGLVEVMWNPLTLDASLVTVAVLLSAFAPREDSADPQGVTSLQEEDRGPTGRLSARGQRKVRGGHRPHL